LLKKPLIRGRPTQPAFRIKTQFSLSLRLGFFGEYDYGGDGGREASNGVSYGGFAQVSQVCKNWHLRGCIIILN
jgi:hypothetical protein